mmetsp:Transcript_28158/g.53159  ORF Transcript_28158/g.53159 Transcript_28158/m.53159 type:complete len:128 (+) Transcript_28158:2522-2905(+)
MELLLEEEECMEENLMRASGTVNASEVNKEDFHSWSSDWRVRSIRAALSAKEVPLLEPSPSLELVALATWTVNSSQAYPPLVTTAAHSCARFRYTFSSWSTSFEGEEEGNNEEKVTRAVFVGRLTAA